MQVELHSRFACGAEASESLHIPLSEQLARLGKGIGDINQQLAFVADTCAPFSISL